MGSQGGHGADDGGDGGAGTESDHDHDDAAFDSGRAAAAVDAAISKGGKAVDYAAFASTTAASARQETDEEL